MSVATSIHSGTIARFGDFELDLASGELRRDGALLKLQPQPSKVLVLLVSRAGEMVTRGQLADRVWGSDTFVDFEHGLNFSIRQIRTALGEDADHPRFIETIPKRGYRFIAPIKPVATPPSNKLAARKWWRLALAVTVALLLGVAVYATWPRSAPVQPPHETVLAVLPFDDLSPDAEEYLVDGLTEEMIAQLTRIRPEIKVIARTSAMQYLHTKKGAREIGQELGADYILENSIRHENGRLRITAQLVRTSDQTHLWAQNYDREMRDLLPLESEVTTDIAEQINLHLSSGTANPASKPQAVDPEAHQLYLKGRHAFNQRSRQGLQESISYFTQALAKDPGYAAAYAGLADSYNMVAFYGFDPSMNVVSQAKISADKALKLDDSMAAAHAALGYTVFMWRGSWQMAEREFRRAIELDDNYVPAHQWYALYLASNGRVDEAVAQMQYAQKLDPLSPSVHTGLGYMYYFAHDYDHAAEEANIALQLNADFMAAHAVLGWALTEQKRYERAIQELEIAAKISGGVPAYVCSLGRAYALSGNTSAARKILAQSAAMTHEPQGNGTPLAALYLALGDSDRALYWLDSTAPGDVQANWLRVDPAFYSLRGNPRFEAVLRRISTSDN